MGASLLMVYEAEWDPIVCCSNGWGVAAPDVGIRDERGRRKKNLMRPPCVVKLIDFAHARMVPGQGPDEGVLKGVDTVLSLLDGRITQIETLVEDVNQV